jgi:hypothetical protein
MYVIGLVAVDLAQIIKIELLLLLSYNYIYIYIYACLCYFLTAYVGLIALIFYYCLNDTGVLALCLFMHPVVYIILMLYA